MSLYSSIRQCHQCISLTRQLTDSAVHRGAQRSVKNLKKKFLLSIRNIRKEDMSMQNQSKLLTLLKDYLNKFGYEKSLQVILSKYWVELIQKIEYTQGNTIRKLSLVNVQKQSDKILKGEESKIETSKDLTLMTEQEKQFNGKTIDSEKLMQKMIERSTFQKEDVKLNASNDKFNLKEQSYTIPQIITALILKMTSRTKESSLVATSKWKVNINSNIPKHSIISRTRYLLNSIVIAKSTASKWRRIEDLLTHIDQYPEARHYAITEGALTTLLRIRQKTHDEQIKASIRESLAIMGYVDPPIGRGIRILSIDGGGIRGLLVIQMLKKLEELTGKKTHEMFDYICGVSTGAIIASTLVVPKESDEGGLKRKSLDEINELYKDLSIKVFTQSAIKGTSSLMWSHAYYDTALWEKLLRETIGDKLLIKTNRDPNAPKFSAISAVVNHERVMAYVFRNYTLPHKVESQYMGSHKHRLWEAARASAAAPSYFEEYKHGECLHQDGGILVNNPCAVAIHEAKRLWPNNSIQCVISLGTGRTLNRICDNDSTSGEVAISSWKEKFYKILDSATDTEAVHTMLNDLLPNHIYFRFNPYLTEMLSMVEIRPDKINQLEQDAQIYIRRNEEKFEKAAVVLSQSRSIQQKLLDWVTLQKRIAGF
ncbi:PREDICTED: calcium-independent phospholipase A2-gamma-like isoform X3 [Polistes canadensis]|uniref:calcium-independent phospholipase A2-gamma-like isoform X3 n=2 Tax=Polistes canadensis TaxID=91411 RepID=UPI000718C942|nr:PREDICTED: calcium-independent phospholipase A2-gamma-like isoform X3 [Polistes canadensis]